LKVASITVVAPGTSTLTAGVGREQRALLLADDERRLHRQAR